MSTVEARADMLVRQFVFPLALVTTQGDDLRYDGLLGTAFLVGGSACALTAAHVLRGEIDSTRALVTDAEGKWSASRVDLVATHESTTGGTTD